MHEVGIMEQTMVVALDQARRAGGTQIHGLKLRIGALSGVEPDALRFAFDVVTQGTIAEAAKLEIDFLPAICYCHHCQKEFEPEAWIYACPTCEKLSSDIRQGKEMELSSVEIS